MIYLDNSSTTRPLDEVCRAMDLTNRETWGNPSSMHHFGHLAEIRIKECKKELAGILSCDPQEILFTSCATESTNTALKGFWESYPRAGRHMLTSLGEHKATSESCSYLKGKGVAVDYLPLNPDGTIDLDCLLEKIRPETSLLSFIHVSNETGAILDVEKLVRIRDQFCPDAKIHLDCVQSFGKLPVRIGKLGVDYVSISAHKIHGPKGIGILYHKKSAKSAPLIHGGGQQLGLRSGTENLSSIMGLTVAAREAYEEIDKNYRNAAELGILLLAELEKNRIVFDRISTPDGSPYIMTLSFPGMKAETLLHAMESKDVYVSTQSACSSKKLKASPVLLAMGIGTAAAESAIRFSFGRFNTPDEMVRTAVVLKEAIAFLTPENKKIGG